VEGFETEVIRGMDFHRCRPWILVIEATLPDTRIPNHQKWEPLLLDREYRFAYFDGLNRYYVSREHRELALALATPPNVFDDFLTIHEARALASCAAAEKRAQEAEARAEAAEHAVREAHASALAAEEAARAANARAQQAEARMHDARKHAQDLEEALQAANQRLHAIHTSTSWKVTAPLRAAGSAIGRGKRGAHRADRAAFSPRALMRHAALALMRRAIPAIRRHPLLHDWASRAYRLFPSLGERLKSHGISSAAPDAAREEPDTPAVRMDVPPAWGGNVTPASHFKAMLEEELQRRRNSGN
jgi:hypothetical protein